MAMQNYSTVASRNLIDAEMLMLKHAEGEQVLTMFGDHKDQPLRKTDTRVFRRLNPFNMSSTTGAPVISPTSFIVAEGTTPTPEHHQLHRCKRNFAALHDPVQVLCQV